VSEGVFTAAYRLLDGETLDAADQDGLKEVLGEFN
jgi:hypothetical protein